MSTLQFFMLLPGSIAAVVTLALHVGHAVGAQADVRRWLRARRLKRRLLGRSRKRRRQVTVSKIGEARDVR